MDEDDEGYGGDDFGTDGDGYEGYYGSVGTSTLSLLNVDRRRQVLSSKTRRKSPAAESYMIKVQYRLEVELYLHSCLFQSGSTTQAMASSRTQSLRQKRHTMNKEDGRTDSGKSSFCHSCIRSV
jgi:hypothetical protein